MLKGDTDTDTDTLISEISIPIPILILFKYRISILIRYRYDTFGQKYRNFDTDTIVSKVSAKPSLLYHAAFCYLCKTCILWNSPGCQKRNDMPRPQMSSCLSCCFNLMDEKKRPAHRQPTPGDKQCTAKKIKPKVIHFSAKKS